MTVNLSPDGASLVSRASARGRLGLYLLIVVLCTGLPALVEWATTPPPSERTIHLEAFRYGTEPSVVRAHRGDQLTVTFSTRDTAHSFFLQDYGLEAKIAPGRDTLEVVDPQRPTEPPVVARELHITAGSPGFWGSLNSVSRFRCHIYCGPMHGFEQGDLIVRPNYLLWSSLGLLVSLVSIGALEAGRHHLETPRSPTVPIDLNQRFPWLDKIVQWRPVQFFATLPVLAGFILIVLAGLWGTKVGGRNLAVMMTWVVWMAFLTLVLVPLSTRAWCFVCPLPLFGELLQRGSLTEVRPATSARKLGNRFFGWGRRWPQALQGPWLRMVLFVALGSLSASLAGQPRWTAYLLLSLAGLAVVTALIWELRAFCRYLCPAAAFISLYSAVGRVRVRHRAGAVCSSCADKSCLRGNSDGWACSFGQYLPALTSQAECGICTECFKSCPNDNVSLSWRRGPWTDRFTSYGEAWQAVVMLVLAMAYCLTVLSPWPAVRDLANVVDRPAGAGIVLYASSVAALAFGGVPLVFWIAVSAGRVLASPRGKDPIEENRGTNRSTGRVFKRTMPALVPLGLGLWAAFFSALVMVNFTFIRYTLSDPFGWGWDLLGTAGMPWIQLWPGAIPWLQSAMTLIGLGLSLRLGYRCWLEEVDDPGAALRGFMPTAAVLSTLAAGMIVYFTYF